MDTRAASQVLKCDHETLLELARLGLVGKQKFAGEPWDFSSAEVAAILRGIRTLKGSFKEAAQLHRLRVIILRLQKEPDEAIVETELASLQKEALQLAMELKGSHTIEIVRAMRSLVRQGCGGAGQILQSVLT
jgi:hypothetical protein